MQSTSNHTTPRQFTRNRKPSSTTTTPLRTLTRTPPSRSNKPPTPGFLVPTFTPVKPTLLDPESPFVVPSTIKNAQAIAAAVPSSTNAFFSPSCYPGTEPSSVHRGMRAKLFGQGVEGGYLVSPLGITPWKRSTGKMGAGGMGMGTPNGRGGDLTGVDPFVVHPGEDETFVPPWESMRGVPGEDEEHGTGTSMGGFQDGFDYLPHSHSQPGQGESNPSEGFGLHQGMRYPSGLGLGAGFVPSTSLGSRVPPGTITQRTVSFRRNQPQSTENVHAQEQDLDPSGSSLLPTPRSNGPLLSLHPASSPFPTMEPASTPSQERSNPSVIHVGPAGRRMHQQGLSSSIPPTHPINIRSASSSHLNTVGAGTGARLGGSILMSRSVSTSAIGLHPTPSSSLSASSTPSTTTTTTSSAFTSRPLVRMGFSRNVSDCSVETAGTVSSINTNTSNAEPPLSPHLYADSTPGTGTESPKFSSTTTTGYGHFQPYFPLHLPPSSRTNHHRHLSGTMSLSTTDGTPVLDSSLPSPAFTQGHSPLITPVVGGSNGLRPPRSSGTYLSSTSALSSAAAGSEYAFQRKLSGLAIQVDGTDACWDQGPLSAMSVLSANASASASASGHNTPCSLVTGHEQMTVSSALGVMDPDQRSSISPADPSEALLGNQLQAAQAAAFETYGLGAQYAGLNGQGDYELGSVQLGQHDGIPSEQQQQQSHSHWLPNDTSAYPSPMGLTLPVHYYPVSAAGTSNHGSRHVSSPFHAFPARSTLDGQPAQSHLPAPRSVSAGYIPMMTPGFSQDSFLNMNNGTGSNDSLSYAHSNPPGSALPDHPHSASSYSVSFPTASGSSMGLMSAILDEGNDHASKRQRIKYPPVGKRLRPGPKPKPRTPKSKGRENLGAGAHGRDPLPYDPFVEIARDSVKESRSIMSDVIEDGPVLSRPSSAVPPPIVTAPPSTTVTPAGSASPCNPPTALTTTALTSEPQSAIPRSYLESCYIMFMIPDPENGGAPTKRYRCNIDDCQRVFPRKSAIHSHIQTHLEDKPFVCTEPEW
jgi:hypothetical protein